MEESVFVTGRISAWILDERGYNKVNKSHQCSFLQNSKVTNSQGSKQAVTPPLASQ